MEHDELDLSAPRHTRIGVILAVAALHILAIVGLIHAFAPQFTAKAVESVVSTISVIITAPEPSPEPAKPPEPAGAAGDIGKKAIPREVKAQKPKIEIAKSFAPRAASTGSADSSGARDTGTGTGAGGAGDGTGSGNGGSGQGGGVARKAEKIAGDITSARDYPRESRDLRNGDHVIVAITVGTNGHPTACRVHRPSKDAEANAITCRLAMQRFRFRPASDGAGNPVVSTYGWKQSWRY